MTIKAIQTFYNGYRFRSRLEARWAVFFDTLGIEYLYEHEGYDLGDAGYYLPDFWLPELERFVEIKPFKLNDDEWRKADELSAQAHSYVMVLVGSPKTKVGTFGDSVVFEYKAYLFREGCDVIECSQEDIWRTSYRSPVANACQVAMSARFEHGETPVQR